MAEHSQGIGRQTGKLLQDLKSYAREHSLPLTMSKAVQVTAATSSECHLVLVAGIDLVHLLSDSRMIGSQSANLGQGSNGSGPIPALDAVPGSLGKEMHSHDENEREEKLEPNRNPVRAGIGPFMSGIVDNGREKDADGDGKLICTHNEPTDPFGSGLGLVKGDC